MYLGYISQANAGFKYRAEAAVFMASIVPRVYKCNKDDGETLYQNLKVAPAQICSRDKWPR